MEPNKKLKLIPLHQFFKIMDGPSKILYLVLFLALVASAVGMLLATENPAGWVLSTEQLPADALEQVELRAYEQGYRTMNTEIGAWKQDVAFYTTPMTPRPWIVISFVVMQILGWAYMLTAASYIKNFFAYAVFFLYAMAIFLSRTFEAIAPGQYWLFNLGLAALIFVPAYLFQQGILHWRFALRLPLFLAITALPFAISFTNTGWLGLHSASVGMFPLLAFMAIIYFIFISKDISQLMFFAGTNMPRKNLRATLPIFLAVFLTLCALEFLMLHNAMGWTFIPGAENFPVKPMHLLFGITLLMPGLNQNFSYTLKENMDNRSFSILITAMGLIVGSSIFLNVGLGEFLYGYALERLLAILFFIGGLLHFFYMYYNFGDFLRARLNFYFLSMMPKRLLYIFVVAATVLSTLALEASEGMKTQRLLKAVAYNRNADQEMLDGRIPEAIALYNAAVATAAGCVKGNYNQAMLLMRMEGDLGQAEECLQKASSFIPFAPAWINLGNLEMSGGNPMQAKYYLSKGWKQVRDPYLASNLAQAHIMLQNPDSAILAMKDALRLAPEIPALYANMGRIYIDHGRSDAAHDFLEAGLKLPNPGAAVVTNALFLNMKYGAKLDVPESLLEQEAIRNSRPALFNFAVERYKRKDYTGASGILDALLAANETPDALLLDGMLRFERGDVAGAISRMVYMDVNYREYQAYTNHFLATAFFNAGVPEMAAAYFGKSVENGRSDDLLNQARMEIDRGDHDFGFMLLNMARTQDTSLFDEVAREEALLQIANGEYFFASIGFDLGSLTPKEWLRAGIYAGQKGNRPAALEAFRHAIDLDTTAMEPFLEMGRISLALDDTLALENLLPGQRRAPKSIPMRIELARAEYKLGDRKKAIELQEGLLKEAKDDFDVRTLQAEFRALQGDTSEAITLYKALYELQPMNKKVVIGLVRLMRAKRMDFEGQNLMADVLAINPRNADYWYEMAQFERLLDRTEEVAKAAQTAIGLEPNPARAQSIAEEFKAEITAFPVTPSEN